MNTLGKIEVVHSNVVGIFLPLFEKEGLGEIWDTGNIANF